MRGHQSSLVFGPMEPSGRWLPRMASTHFRAFAWRPASPNVYANETNPLT